LLLAGLDGGGSPTLQVYHHNTAASRVSAPHINRLKALGNGGQQLTFAGQLGFGYRVWSSTNLVQWSLRGTPNEGSPANFQFSDRGATNTRHRFYRVSQP
jgi:hypothetical protein